MHTVVNHLPIKADADWTEMTGKFDQFIAEVRPAYPAIRTAQLLKVDDTEAILVITFADAATTRDFSANVAAPWFAENIRPYLSGPVARSVGEMIAGFV